MRSPSGGIAGASIVILGLSLAGLSPAAADAALVNTPEAWFTDHISGPEGGPLPGVLETRWTTFDADAAVATLVSDVDLASVRTGQYKTAIPQSDAVLELFDERNVTFEMDGLALRLPYDSPSTKPHVDAGGTHRVNGDAYGSAALSFVPDASDSYQLNGSIVDSVYGNFTINWVSGNMYRLDRVADRVGPPFENPDDVLYGPQVPPTHRFYCEIMWVIASGISTGYADGTFRPQSNLNRKSAAAFLYRLAGSPSYTPPSSSPFLDVSTSSQFYKEISWLAAQGISNGYTVQGGKEFRPLESVKREAMAAFLYRFAGSPSYNPPLNSPFPEVPTSSSFYKHITWLNAAEITTGYSDGTFRPDSPVARYAMAAFLYRLYHMVD